MHRIFHVLLFCFLFYSIPREAEGLEREADGAYSPHVKHQNEVEFHHEAIIGSDAKHKEFHGQSPEESRAKLLELAAGHDLDGDGKISLDELQKWIYKSFQDISAEDAHNKFEDVDADKDGFVTWSEHLSETWGLPSDENQLLSEEYKDEVVMIKEEELLFKAADRDQDGKLTPEEFQAFERPEQYEYMQPLVILRTKEERDKNGDGFIDFHEYIVDLLPNYKGMNKEEKETFTSEKERFDSYFDANHDGHLDDGEIFRWLIPDDNATAAAEAEHIMEKSDINKDGLLTLDEIGENQEIFVGSEITDYGNQLNVNHEHNAHEEL